MEKRPSSGMKCKNVFYEVFVLTIHTRTRHFFYSESVFWLFVPARSQNVAVILYHSVLLNCCLLARLLSCQRAAMTHLSRSPPSGVLVSPLANTACHLHHSQVQWYLLKFTYVKVNGNEPRSRPTWQIPAIRNLCEWGVICYILCLE